MKELEWLWPYPQEIDLKGKFRAPTELILQGAPPPHSFNEDFNSLQSIKISENSDTYPLKLKQDDSTLQPEEYNLVLTESGGTISSGDPAGLSYGIQTLQQIISLSRGGFWPEVEINDRPSYRKRCFMLDMGRSIFPLPMLKRIIRILHRLKMNQLHLHLYDDELCGLRFDGLPFGKDNPYAMSMADFAELIQYAQSYQIEIVPELEAWGHVGSIVYHKKNLRGGDGMYNGSSFLICEETFTLMKEIISQVVKVMPNKATIHLGLDEAKWFLGPEMPEDYTPSNMVEHYYNILQEIGKEQNKELTLRLWADHAGRPVPEHIQDNVIIEPWQYWQAKYDSIDEAIAKYSGNKNMRWMAGTGVSVGQPRGAFHATRYWSKQAQQSTNIDGINITFWGTNDLESKFIGLFSGAYYTWNSSPPTSFAEIDDYEDYDRNVFPIMHWWQAKFRDAFPDDLQKDRGPIVHMGYYLWGKKHGHPVSPEGIEANTLFGHDFINE